MPDPDVRSVPAELTGAAALGLFPPRCNRSEVLFACQSLRAIDAHGAVVLGLAIEYHCRFQKQHVSFTQIRDEAAWEQFVGSLIHDDVPVHLTRPEHWEQVVRPRNVHLAATRIRGHEHATRLVDELLPPPGSEGGRELRFLLTQLPELACNSFHHGDEAPTEPVACLMRDLMGNELQLVVGSMNSRTEPRNARSRLDAIVAAPVKGPGRDAHAIRTIAETAIRRQLDARVFAVSRTERLIYDHDARWQYESEAVDIPGFLVGVSVPL